MHFELLAGLLLAAGLSEAKATVKAGHTVTFRATTQNYTDFYVAHTGSTVNILKVAPTNVSTHWLVTAPLNTTAGAGCFSFQPADTPNNYIRNYNYHLYVNPSDGTDQFKADATYCMIKGHVGRKTKSFYSPEYPTRFFRHYNEVMYIATNGGAEAFDDTRVYGTDTSFQMHRARGRRQHSRSIEMEFDEEEEE